MPYRLCTECIEPLPPPPPPPPHPDVFLWHMKQSLLVVRPINGDYWFPNNKLNYFFFLRVFPDVNIKQALACQPGVKCVLHLNAKHIIRAVTFFSSPEHLIYLKWCLLGVWAASAQNPSRGKSKIKCSRSSFNGSSSSPALALPI